MADDNDKDKKGFSGLSDLASEVSGVEDIVRSEPKAEAKTSKPKQPPQPQREIPPTETERKAPASPPTIETVSSGKSGGGSGALWIFGIIGIIFVIWLANNGGQKAQKSSYYSPTTSSSDNYPQNSPPPAVSFPNGSQRTGWQYEKPSVGTNYVLSVPQIRWCVREKIRIEAMRDIIDNNNGIDEFNKIVNDYNSRCGNYLYEPGSLEQAQREVDVNRTQIVVEAKSDARNLGHNNYPSAPSVSPEKSTTTSLKGPNEQLIREVQRILTALRYDPGLTDGQLGRRTVDAVKNFQKDVGLSQDGRIDEPLLNLLRRARDSKGTVETLPQENFSNNNSSSPKYGTVDKGRITNNEHNKKNLDAEMRKGVAERVLAHNIVLDWQNTSLSQLVDAEGRINVVARIMNNHGLLFNWQENSLSTLIDAEGRIDAAQRINSNYGQKVDWKSYTLSQLLGLESRLRAKSS